MAKITCFTCLFKKIYCVYDYICIIYFIINLIMAIAIKSIPVLKDEAARAFTSAVTENTSKKSSVDFSKQVSVATKILAKAKI